MTLAVRILNGVTSKLVCELEESAEATVSSVKGNIFRTAGIPPDEQRLFCDNKLLWDTTRLEDAVLPHIEVGECGSVELVLMRETLIEDFEDLELKEPSLQGIYAYGFEKPSQMQKLVMRPLMDGRNVIALSQSGTGKTAAYVVASLHRMNLSMIATQALVLAPTRELACPIQKVAIALGDFMRVSTLACVGRTTVRDDMDALADNPQFVVGTPGRLHELIERRALRLDNLNTFVLDEMDEMDSRGFKGLMFETMELLPPSVQLAVFSATMPPELLKHMKNVMHDPMFITAHRDELSLEGIRQFYVAVEKEEYKVDTLCELLEFLPDALIVLYCNTRRKADFLAQEMAKRDLTTIVIHGQLDKTEQDLATAQFLSGSSGRILISTDLHGPRVDLQQVSLVVNYDLPANRDSYLQRIGRCGRFGRKGVTINVVTEQDARALKEIEKYYHTQIEEMPTDIADLI